MAKTIEFNLSKDSIGNAIKELKEYKKWVLKKETELRTRLAEIGADKAKIIFSGAAYDGNNDISVTFSDNGQVATITASGKALLFIEFGSGLIGYGHPDPGEYGPGTWSDNPDKGGKGHWDNPDGWYYKHGEKSKGNPPAMGMYQAVNEIAENITRIAREVFAN